MDDKQARLIVTAAAPIYAALLARHWKETRCNIPPEMLSTLRGLAITQAVALWADALEWRP